MSRISVRGWLLSDSGLAIPSRLVEAYVSGTTTPAATTSTDGNGQWSFPSLAEATYDVKQEALGRARWLRGGRQEQVSELQVVDLLNLGAVASVSGLLAAHLPVVLASGTYTPTLSNDTNLAASAAYLCHYLRVGNTVTVSGSADVDPTAAGQCELGITLPVASDIATSVDVGGVGAAHAVAAQSAGIYGDGVNNRATMGWVAVDTAVRRMWFTFTYTVK